MTEADPGMDREHNAGNVGARRATVGTPTDDISVNVPPTRPGAAENALADEAERESHETFVPQPPIAEERPADDRPLPEATQDSDVQPEQEPGEEAVKQDIVRTRQDLGDTVEALAAKADVPSRVRDQADEVMATAKEKAGDAVTKAKKRPVLVLAAVGAVVALVVRRLLKRRR
ncbi:DUF3618 domain-containing protein [Nonomuraea sp. NPDC050790]|uniref:DUF3618 domain-containing protein n=1 Tax=Nonomuraea sp. NPDC050790 TaxID=3364371 RepID=UPI0037B4F5FB